MPSAQETASDRMRCMEVWGGNSPIDRGFETPGLEVWVYSQPHERAAGGGDVYYASSCASGRITRLLLADVSGHGDAVADVATGLRNLMRRNVNLIKQTRFVREMNRQFSDESDLDVFATALVCTFFAPTRSLQFCNAGHPVPFLYRAASGTWTSAQELAAVERSNGLAETPLGVIDEAGYSQFKTGLSPGDMVLCVSDAFTESLDVVGKMLGTDGLLSIVKTLDVLHPSTIIAQLRTGYSRSTDNLPGRRFRLLFRADGSATSAKNTLMAPFRLMSGLRDNTEIV